MRQPEFRLRCRAAVHRLRLPVRLRLVEADGDYEDWRNDDDAADDAVCDLRRRDADWTDLYGVAGRSISGTLALVNKMTQRYSNGKRLN